MKRWLLLAAACGGGDGGTADAPRVDAAADALSSAAVVVTVTADGAPIAGATVVFQDGTSTPIATATTDANGDAQADMPTGGFVTVIETGATDMLRTYAGVKPGDHLVLADAVTDFATKTFTLAFPADPGADAYDVIVLCSTGGRKSLTTTSGQVTVKDCDGTADVLVFSRNQGAFVHGLFQRDVAVSDGGSATLTATFGALATESFSYTNAGSASLIQLAAFQGGDNGTTLESQSQPPITNGSASFASASAKIATGIRDVVTSTVTVGAGQQTVIDIGDPATSYTLDVGATLLPAVTTPAFDTPDHAVTWTSTGGALAPDTAVVQVNATRAARSWIWRMTAPYVAGNATLPVLPTVGGVDYNVAAGDTATVAVTILQVTGGYDAIRKDVLSSARHGAIPFPFGVNSTARIVLE